MLRCRLCKNTELIDIIDLGDQLITSRFPDVGDTTTPSNLIVLVMCESCKLVQLKHTTESSELYEHQYGYRSGISNTMRQHLSDYQQDVLSKISLSKGDIVVDIGSNDATTLNYYPDTVRRIGVDPTGKQFESYYGKVELLPTYFTYENFHQTYGDIKCKVVSSISMFYDLPDPVKFAKDIYSILADDGIWTCEQSYLPTMLKQNSMDTICHEHLEYYSLHQIKDIADRANLKIIDVQFNGCNGGSFRVYFAKKSNENQSESPLIDTILQREVDEGVLEVVTYKSFMDRCQAEVQKLCDFLKLINGQNKEMWIYGASTKGNCLLQYAELGPSDMKYAVERNPKKIGKMTSTGIPIIGEEKMRANPPQYLLVLPWHFRDEIIKREDKFLSEGGQLVFPFPKFEIYGKKKGHSSQDVTGTSRTM